MFCDSGFTRACGGGDNYRITLVYIVNCLLLKGVVNHPLIIMQNC